jgi:hypothetical protein
MSYAGGCLSDSAAGGGDSGVGLFCIISIPPMLMCHRTVIEKCYQGGEKIRSGGEKCSIRGAGCVIVVKNDSDHLRRAALVVL